MSVRERYQPDVQLKPAISISKFASESVRNSVLSSKSVSWSGGGGGWKTLYIKIGYSEPPRVESREWSSTLAESSRVT